MLKQASIQQIKKGEITRGQGFVVATMAFYPRGLKKELLDEYRADLAPDRDLFRDFKEQEPLVGHNEAFQACQYEQRFHLTRRAADQLKILADLSKKQDVFLACQCEIGQKCHREILLLIAQKKFGAEISALFHSYPEFEARMSQALGERINI